VRNRARRKGNACLTADNWKDRTGSIKMEFSLYPKTATPKLKQKSKKVLICPETDRTLGFSHQPKPCNSRKKVF